MRIVFSVLAALIFIFMVLRPFEYLQFDLQKADDAAVVTPVDRVEPEPVKEDLPPHPEVSFSSEDGGDESPTDMGFAASGWGAGGFSNVGGTSAKHNVSGVKAIAAKAVSQTEPVYPAEAKNRGITGAVTLKLGISDSGQIIDYVIVASEPPGIFDSSAIAAVKSWKFAPAQKDGRRVASFLLQKISFRME